MESPRVGLIGVGLMGGAMATVLLSKGFALKVFDLNPKMVSALVEKGAEAAGSSAEAAAGVDVLCTSLPDAHILRDVYLGSGQALATAPPGSVLVELSTTEPAAVKALHEAAMTRGVLVVDSPVSGGPVEVLRQDTIMLVGATDEAFRRAEPVLRALSGSNGRIFRVGDVGAGKVVKLVNNVLTYCNVATMCETFVTGVKAGIEPRRLYELLSVSEGRSNQFAKRIPLALKRDFAPGGTIRTAIKDLGLALALGRDLGCPMPITSTIQQLYLAAIGKGFGADDYLSVLRLYEQWAGVKVSSQEQSATKGSTGPVGPVGTGGVVEMGSIVMAMCSLAAAAESFTVGVKAGLNPKVVFDVLSVGAGRSQPLIERFPHMLSRDFQAHHSIGSGLEDLRLWLDLAQKTGCPMPATALVQQLYSAAAAEGHREEDLVAVIKLFEAWAGVEAGP